MFVIKNIHVTLMLKQSEPTAVAFPNFPFSTENFFNIFSDLIIFVLSRFILQLLYLYQNHKKMENRRQILRSGAISEKNRNKK